MGGYEVTGRWGDTKGSSSVKVASVTALGARLHS